MIIKRVEAENLKGRAFAYNLAPMNIITGQNFTGKSTIIDAIRLALIGYIPELGKTNAATWQLASGEAMAVKVLFDNGDPMRLSAYLEKGSPKIMEEGFEFPAGIPLLNAAAYFAMSERERYDYVFKIAKLPEAFTVNGIIAELERISFEEKHTEAVETAKNKLISLLRVPDSYPTVRDWLNANIDGLKILFSQWNTRAKDTQGAIRVLAELKNRQEHQAGNVKQLAEAQRIAQAATDSAYKELLRLRGQASDYEKQARRAERVASLRKAVDDNTEVADKEKQIEEAKKQLKPNVQSGFSQDDLEQLESHLGRLRNDRQLTKMAVKDASKALDALKTATQCPYCHSTGDDWKKTLRAGLKETLELNEAKLIKIEAAIPEVEAKVAAAKTELDRVLTDLAHNKTINANIVTWEAQLVRIKWMINKWSEELAKEEAAMAAEKVEPVSAEDLRVATANSDNALEDLAVATDKLKAAELLEHDLKRAAQSEIEHNNAVAHVAVIKKIGEVLRSKQSELVDAVFGDLLKIANQIAGPILTTALAFHEGEVGRWNGHRWISHKTFSGTEQALTFVAIAAALSQDAPLRLLIFDELGRLDRKRRVMLINLLRQTLENGHIDQFIVAGALQEDDLLLSANHDMNVITL